MVRKKSRFLVMILAGFVIALILEAPAKAEFLARQNKFLSYLTSIIITILVWEGNLRIDTFLNKKFPWTGNALKRVSLQFVSSLLYSAITIYGAMMAYNKYVCLMPLDIQSAFSRTALAIGLVVAVAILSIELGLYFFINWKRSLVEIEKYKAESYQAQLQNLKTQVNPHFLFNNLSVLSSLVAESQDKAQDFIHQMSNVYRYVLDSDSTELVSLEDELKFINSYCYLLEIRFESAIVFDVSIDDVYKQKYIPPMAMQLLIENAIKHNEVSASFPLKISIYAKHNRLYVENTIQHRTESQESKGIGLKNIRKRYAFFTEEEVQVENTSKLFVVSIPFIAV